MRRLIVTQYNLSLTRRVISILHAQNWFFRWGKRFYFKVAVESFLSWDTIRGGFLFRIRFHFQLLKPPLSLSTVMEFTFQVRSKLLTFSLRKLSISSFILNFLECGFIHCTTLTENRNSPETQYILQNLCPLSFPYLYTCMMYRKYLD